MRRPVAIFVPNPLPLVACYAALAFALLAPGAQAAGIRLIDIPAGRVTFSPMTASASPDCPISGDCLPLMAISQV